MNAYSGMVKFFGEENRREIMQVIPLEERRRLSRV